MFKLDLEKTEELEIKLPTSTGLWKSKRIPEKHLFLLYRLCQSLWLCGLPQTVENFKGTKIPESTSPASWEISMQVKKQQLELHMKQQTGSISGKEYFKAVYHQPAYLTYMQSTSWEMLGWMQHKLESRLPGINIDNLRYADDTTFMAESEEELKSLLMKKRRVKMLA